MTKYVSWNGEGNTNDDQSSAKNQSFIKVQSTSQPVSLNEDI